MEYPNHNQDAAPSAAAAAPKDNALDQILNYRNENDFYDDESGYDGRRRRGKKVAPSPPNEDDDLEDTKPAAIPTAGDTRKPPPQYAAPNRPSAEEPGSFYREALQETMRREEPRHSTTLYSPGTATKPGVVAVDAPAIHPNSAMYRAAYGGGETISRSTLPIIDAAVEPINAHVDVIQQAVPIVRKNSKEIADSGAANRGRRRSPGPLGGMWTTRKKSPKSTKADLLGASSAHNPLSGRRRSPKMDPLHATTHNPRARTPLDRDPLGGSSHTPTFFKLAPGIAKGETEKEKRGRSPNSRPANTGGFDRSGHSPKLDQRKQNEQYSDTRKQNTYSRRVSSDPGQSLRPPPQVATHSYQHTPAFHQNNSLPEHSHSRECRNLVDRPAGVHPRARSDGVKTMHKYNQQTFRSPSAERSRGNVSRDVGDSKPFPEPVRQSGSNEDDMDPNLRLALELSRTEQMKSRPSSRATKAAPAPTTARAARHRNSSEFRSLDYDKSPSESSMGEDDIFSPKQTKRGGELSSSFAMAAMAKAANDDASLADVLLALKISAEEEEAVGPGKRQSTSLKELLELESSDNKKEADGEESCHTGDSSVIDLVAAGILTEKDTAKQLRILQHIQEQEEKRLLEMALKASQHHVEDGDDQLRMALEASRNEIQPREGSSCSSERRRSSNFMESQHRAMEEFSKKRSSTSNNVKPPPRTQRPPVDHDKSREALLQRGTAETHRAINSGQARIVTCRGCRGRLQAPQNYALVYCPKCQTVTPI